MFEFLQSLRRRYQAYRYSKVKKQVRENLLFFGCDTSHLTDKEMEQGILDASKIVASFGVTADEATTAFQECRDRIQGMIEESVADHIEGATERHARQNIIQLILDAGFGFEEVEIVRHSGYDDSGRFFFELKYDGRTCKVKMPGIGLSLSPVRLLQGEELSVWDFPNIYIDDSSFVWSFAIASLKRIFLSGEECHLYIVTVYNQPQQFFGHRFLAGSPTDPTFFTTWEGAYQAAQKTLKYAKDENYTGWGIVQNGYNIKCLNFIEPDEGR